MSPKPRKQPKPEENEGNAFARRHPPSPPLVLLDKEIQ